MRNQIRGLTRKIVKKTWKKVADSVKTNLKSFWNYVKKKTKTKTSITDLYVDGYNTILTKTNSEKANVLADVFSLVYTVDNDNVQPDAGSACGFLDEIKITGETVKKIG